MIGPHEKMVLGSIFEARDEIDQLISSEILMLPWQLQTEAVIFGWQSRDDKAHEQHFTQILSLGNTLAKTNEALRSHKETQDLVLAELERKNLHNPNKNTLLAKKSPELEKEIDAFFSGIKSALDILAEILGHVLNIKIDGWHKGVEGGVEISGIKVVRKLKDYCPPTGKENDHSALIEFIEQNFGAITYLVALRDAAHHRGGINGVSDVMYDPEARKLYEQTIQHGRESIEPMGHYMERSLRAFIPFSNNVLLLAYLIVAPSDMVIQRSENPTKYNWAVVSHDRKK